MLYGQSSTVGIPTRRYTSTEMYRPSVPEMSLIQNMCPVEAGPFNWMLRRTVTLPDTLIVYMPSDATSFESDPMIYLSMLSLSPWLSQSLLLAPREVSSGGRWRLASGGWPMNAA